MQVSVGAGTYVVAVSGGVDSVVLLDLLRGHPGVKLIVAHFDHGIRKDSATERKLVQEVAQKHGLPFVHALGSLGPRTSEATARAARYKFLRAVMVASKAKGIITAHHQDDVLETALLNILRGTGRRGLTSLKSSEDLVRPLLDYTKDRLRDYAINHSLRWRDDPTNMDTHFTRNYIRHKILPAFSAGDRAQLLILLQDLQVTNDKLDRELINLLHAQPATTVLNRQWFIALPHDIAREVVHAWLHRHNVRNVARSSIERLIVLMKTARPGRRVDVDRGHILEVNKETLALMTCDR